MRTLRLVRHRVDSTLELKTCLQISSFTRPSGTTQWNQWDFIGPLVGHCVGEAARLVLKLVSSDIEKQASHSEADRKILLLDAPVKSA